jgi:antitoxin VapB
MYVDGASPYENSKTVQERESQALRLPKEFRFDGDEVFIKRVGDAVVLLPNNNSWGSLIESLGQFSGDFMAGRDQTKTHDKRESL